MYQINVLTDEKEISRGYDHEHAAIIARYSLNGCSRYAVRSTREGHIGTFASLAKAREELECHGYSSR